MKPTFQKFEDINFRQIKIPKRMITVGVIILAAIVFWLRVCIL